MNAARPACARRVPVLVCAVGVPLVLVCWWLLHGQPPQMGASEEVFTTVDALFTAVTAHDAKLLEQSARRLGELRAEGQLPAEAATYLDGVIAKARRGRWQPAAETLYDFMMAQRREGAVTHKKEQRSPSPAPRTQVPSR